MATEQGQATPVRGPAHEALSAFLCTWEATGTSFGGPDQSGSYRRANGVPWVSTHETHRHTGAFFLVTSEYADVGWFIFVTLSVMGVDPETGDVYAQRFENHGFERRYTVAHEAQVWTVTGEHERARMEFSDGGLVQTMTWEWKPEDSWLPLGDRVARRTA